MRKKLMVAFGVLVLVIGASFAWVALVGNKRSPEQTVTATVNDVEVKVVYCRPYKKGRVIFGPQASGALVPDGKYWRLGANAATAITFSKDTTLAGKPVQAGTYRMYAIPGPQAWKVVLNKTLGWGAREPDHADDVLSVDVAANAAAAPVEQLTISFVGATMVFAWDTTVVHVPIGS